jgi:DNA-binding NtrC family response regulator
MRRKLLLENNAQAVVSSNSEEADRSETCTALVINSSQDMAKEFTLQITLKMPGCSIMYAPTLQIARWILKRRKIDLVVSNSILPDGNILSLKEVLEGLASPPDVIVVGDMSTQAALKMGSSRYEFSSAKRCGTELDKFAAKAVAPEPKNEDSFQKLRELGADIRNDLNNPLQEIVAMVFVARAGGEASTAAECALQAIDKAAHNMASVVKGLEDKIVNAATSRR